MEPTMSSWGTPLSTAYSSPEVHEAICNWKMMNEGYAPDKHGRRY